MKTKQTKKIEQKTCNTCTRALNDPFRSRDRETGRIVSGCVAADHNGHLTPGTESYEWHTREAARDCRLMTAIHRAKLLAG